MLQIVRTQKQDAIRIEGVLFPLVKCNYGPHELGCGPTKLIFTVDFSSDSGTDWFYLARPFWLKFQVGGELRVHTDKEAYVVQIEKLEATGALLTFHTKMLPDNSAEREECPDLSKVDKAKFLRNLAFLAKAKTVPVPEADKGWRDLNNPTRSKAE